jgi:hypothetical protein
VAFDSVFAAAYIDNGTKHRVLGARLQPFSAWHLLLLSVIDSPFLSSGQVYLYHLRRAVGICRLSFPQSRTRLPFSPLVLTSKRFHQEVSKFLLYTGDYIQRPDYTIIPFDLMGEGRKPGPQPNPPPDVIQLVYDAAHGANIPIDQAWNMPIGQAYVSQAMYYQHRGVMVDFMSDSEREFQAVLKEHVKKQRNGEK